MPKEGELLADAELVHILTKLPHERDPHVTDHDRDMSDYMINQIHSCFTQSENFIYEAMSESKKLLLDVHGSTIPFARNASQQLPISLSATSANKNPGSRGLLFLPASTTRKEKQCV
jgi:hypothetical protein